VITKGDLVAFLAAVQKLGIDGEPLNELAAITPLPRMRSSNARRLRRSPTVSAPAPSHSPAASPRTSQPTASRARISIPRMSVRDANAAATLSLTDRVGTPTIAP